MRAMLYVLVMILVACTEEATSSSLTEGDGGPLDKDSEVQSTDTEPTNDSEKDTEVDSEVKDSETQDSETQDSETQDSDNPDTDTSEVDTDTEEPEPESCVFSEKGYWKCDGNTMYQCKEDPNSSIVELIWLLQGDCPLGTECKIADHITGPAAYCPLIGECNVGQLKCNENNAQVLECVLDEETGGGYWEVKDRCVAQGLKCWSYGYTEDGGRADPKCVPADWVYCGIGKEPNEIECIDNYIVECTMDMKWEVLKNCTEDGQICGNNDGDWICYEPCQYQCTSDSHMTCEDFRGTVVYNAGQCLNGWECCKIPPKT